MAGVGRWPWLCTGNGREEGTPGVSVLRRRPCSAPTGSNTSDWDLHFPGAPQVTSPQHPLPQETVGPGEGPRARAGERKHRTLGWKQEKEALIPMGEQEGLGVTCLVLSSTWAPR